MSKVNEQELQELKEKIRKELHEGQEFSTKSKLLRKVGLQDQKGVALLRFETKVRCFVDFERIREESSAVYVKEIYTDDKVKPYISPSSGGKIKKERLNQEADPFDTKLNILKNSVKYKYVYNIITLLSDYAVRNEQETKRGDKYNFCISNANLLYELGFVNTNYLKLSQKINETIDNSKNNKGLRDIKEMYSFKSLINAVCLKETILGKNDFRRLRSDEFFNYYTEYLVKEDKTGLIRYADVPEKNFINSIKESLGKSTSIFTTKKHREHLNDELFKEFRLSYISAMNHFIFNEKYLPKMIAKEEKEEIIKWNKENIIPRIQKRANKNGSSTYNGYAEYKERYKTEYEYPYNCGNFEEYLRIINSFIEEYIF